MYFEFLSNVRVNIGDGSAEKIGEYFNSIGANHPLLIAGPIINKVGLVDMLREDVRRGGVTVRSVFIDVPKDSSSDVVRELVDIYDNNGCDSIIACGGGSVIDTAKGLRLLLAIEKESLVSAQGIDNAKVSRAVPFAVVPTTSGTGSEVTKVAVISDAESHVKQEFITEYTLPDITAIDAKFTKSLPLRATISTAFDMLTHAIEAYTGTQKNPVSDAFAMKAIDLFRSSFFAVVADTNDSKAREDMAVASLLAGISFSNSMVGLAHAIGHALGGVVGVAHDVAMMMLLPHVMRFNLDECDMEYAKLLYHLAGSDLYMETKSEERAMQSIKFIENIIDKYATMYDIKVHLSDYGVDEETLERVADTAMRDGAIIANRKYASRADVLEILRSVM